MTRALNILAIMLVFVSITMNPPKLCAHALNSTQQAATDTSEDSHRGHGSHHHHAKHDRSKSNTTGDQNHDHHCPDGCKGDMGCDGCGSLVTAHESPPTSTAINYTPNVKVVMGTSAFVQPYFMLEPPPPKALL